jgi:hypothetical protein
MPPSKKIFKKKSKVYQTSKTILIKNTILLVYFKKSNLNPS